LEEIQARLEAAHDISAEPDRRDVTREKELKKLLEGMAQ